MSKLTILKKILSYRFVFDHILLIMSYLKTLKKWLCVIKENSFDRKIECE